MASEIKVTESTASSGAEGYLLKISTQPTQKRRWSPPARSAWLRQAGSRLRRPSGRSTQRQASMLALPSHTRSRLIASLGRQLASAGQAAVPRRARLRRPDRRNGSGPRRRDSAQRLGSLSRTLELPGDAQERRQRLDGPVLVVDDRIETGWTMTVAARLLRQAGAAGVLPWCWR